MCRDTNKNIKKSKSNNVNQIKMSTIKITQQLQQQQLQKKEREEGGTGGDKKKIIKIS